MFRSNLITGIVFLAIHKTYRIFGRTTFAVLLLLFCFTSYNAEEQATSRTLETGSGVVELSILDGTGATTWISTGEPGRLTVDTKITGFSTRWGREKVPKHVEELLRNPPIKQDGNRIIVGDLPWRVRKDVSISYLISVPPNTNVFVQGPEVIHITGLIGNLHGLSGSVVGSGLKGNVTWQRAKAIRITDLVGNLHVAGGSVTVSDVNGDVFLNRSEYVVVENVTGKVSVTDRARVVRLDDVIVDTDIVNHLGGTGI